MIPIPEAKKETPAMGESEPTEVPQSRPKTLSRVLVAVSGVLVVVVCGVWAFNYLSVDRPLRQVLSTDERNHVVKAEAHYGGWVNPNTLVFDLTDVSGSATRMDVFRALLQYAEAMKDRNFTEVVLATRGKSKFTLDGAYFQELGREYNTENPIYTIRTFPIHLVAMDGSKPFSEYEGGIFPVLEKEMEQFTEFSNEWYVNDLQASGRAIP
jgi:hypothetical protein